MTSLLKDVVGTYQKLRHTQRSRASRSFQDSQQPQSPAVYQPRSSLHPVSGIWMTKYIFSINHYVAASYLHIENKAPRAFSCLCPRIFWVCEPSFRMPYVKNKAVVCPWNWGHRPRVPSKMPSFFSVPISSPSLFPTLQGQPFCSPSYTDEDISSMCISKGSQGAVYTFPLFNSFWLRKTRLGDPCFSSNV